MDIKDYIPDAIVIHVGTNSLSSSASVRDCAEEIVKLATMIDDLNFFVLNCKIDVLAIDETKIHSSVSNSSNWSK